MRNQQPARPTDGRPCTLLTLQLQAEGGEERIYTQYTVTHGEDGTEEEKEEQPQLNIAIFMNLRLA